MAGRDLLEADALHAFAAFAERLNFTAAAKSLHISQPSLHTKIRKLGATLGVTLYERDGSRLRLTAAGELLGAFAQDNRRRVDEFMRDLHEELPVLAIAAGRGALRWVIDEPIRQVSRQGRTVQAISADRPRALDALAAGRADLAVLAHDAPPRHYDSRRIATYTQNLVIDARHPLATRRTLRLGALNGMSLVVPPPEREHRRAIERALLDANVSWHIAAEVEGWDLLIHLTDLGMGATIVNGCVTLPASLAAVPITDLPRIDYWAAWRPSRTAHVADLLAQFRDHTTAAKRSRARSPRTPA